jgi:hypothetical protein
VPVIGRKGGPKHRWWGRIFVISMVVTGTVAVGISTLTVLYPVETHPHIPDPAFVRGIFGWMMMYLGILTVNLAWYGWLAVRNMRRYERNRVWHNLLLQAVLFVAAVNCLVQGWLIGEVLMIGISMIGFATVATNVNAMYRNPQPPMGWLVEHFKGLVGAGISVYTAFLAFGAVRLMPELALNPLLWAVPLTTGMAIILYHRRDVMRKSGRLRSRPLGESVS